MVSATLIQSYEKLRESAGLVSLSNRGAINMKGSDCASYLQGLLTNDISGLTTGAGCYAAYLTPQGRMIADMRVLNLGDRLLLDVDSAMSDTLTSRFSMLVFSEDVQVNDESSTWYWVGVRGPGAAACLEPILRPERTLSGKKAVTAYQGLDNGWWVLDGKPVLAVSNDELGIPGIDLGVSSAYSGQINAQLEGLGLEWGSAGAVEALRVEAGTPRFGADMDEDTIPLEAGIEARAISETKGCYVGQEVIIRILHRGKGRVARRLVGLIFSQDHTTKSLSGQSVYDGHETIGRVRSAISSPRLGRQIALAYVQRAYTAPGARVEVADGERRVAAEVTELPFPPSLA
ncbi:MAG: hypothetical protein CL479_07240 [Acidobacteria bacterium]|nr:hypothetical protein [Acidobacteriota bacterium]